MDDEQPVTEGHSGNSCSSETGDLLAASQYGLAHGSVFITTFATISNNIPPLVELQFMLISREVNAAGVGGSSPRAVQ